MSAAGAHDVVIVGGGPAGLAAAGALRRAGVRDVVVLEREREAGGIPRHCGHRSFGLVEFRRALSGPEYARRLRADSATIDVRTATTVTALRPDGVVRAVSSAGPLELRGRRLLLATGARETPRAARLVSGSRAGAVLTTSALQQLVYLQGLRPMTRAVVVGTELVAFSALMTLRHAGIAVAAVVEPASRPTFWWPALAFPRALRVPVLLGTELVAIAGGARVRGVRLRGGDGRVRTVACDGVVFTGAYVPESALLRRAHLDLTPGVRAPVVDQTWACSDGITFAAGNLLRPVETAAWAYRKGQAAGEAIAASLRAGDGVASSVPVTWSESVKIVVPQRLRLPGPDLTRLQGKVRVAREVRGRLRVVVDGRVVCSQRIHALPDRRVSLPRNLPLGAARERVHVEIEPSREARR